MEILKAENLSVQIGKKQILHSVSFDLQENEKIIIIGPNGAGKTTLIRALTHLQSGSGTVKIFGRDAKTFSRTEFAQTIGILTQHHALNFDFSVDDIVSMGRYAHRRSLFQTDLCATDKEKIEEALYLTDLGAFRHRNIRTLSGGEIQRVFLAQIIAQDPNVLILDEPTNHLDIQYQMKFFDMINVWVAQPQRAVILIMHDLNLAFTYGSRVMLLKEGEAKAFGPTAKVLTRTNLADVYEADVYGWMNDLLQKWQE